MEHKQRMINLTIEPAGEPREWYVHVTDSEVDGATYHFKDAGTVYALYKSLHRHIRRGYGCAITITSNHGGFIHSVKIVPNDPRTLSRMTRDVLFDTNSVITAAALAE